MTNVHTYEVKWTRADGSQRTSTVQGVHGFDTERAMAERLVREPRALGDVAVAGGVPQIHAVTKLDDQAAARAKATRPKLPPGLEKHLKNAEEARAVRPAVPANLPAASAETATEATENAAADQESRGG